MGTIGCPLSAYIYTHALQVVLFRVRRALKSLLDPLPQFSYALPAWGAHAEDCPLRYPGSQAGLLLVFSPGLACSVRRGLLGAIPELGGSLAGGLAQAATAGLGSQVGRDALEADSGSAPAPAPPSVHSCCLESPLGPTLAHSAPAPPRHTHTLTPTMHTNAHFSLLTTWFLLTCSL